VTIVGEIPTLPAVVTGFVRHGRSIPIRHAFRHRVYQWLVDLDDLPRLPWYLRPLGGFDVRVHLGGHGPTIKAGVRRYLAGHGIEYDGRIVMLANARVLGHVFDPITVFWCVDSPYVVAEVHNTYGERHAYLLTPDADGTAETAKKFYVSPFNDVSGDYQLRFELDRTRVRVQVSLTRGHRTVFGASFDGVPRPATRRAVLAAAVRMPLMPQRVSGLIRLHGLWLWARRLPVVKRSTRRTLRGRIARLIVDRVLDRVPVRAVYPDGTVRGGGGPDAPILRVIRPDSLYERLAQNPKIGLGEAYTAGDWEPGDGTDLGELLTPFAERLTKLVPRPLVRFRSLVDQQVPDRLRNTPNGARSNISAHYDLSNGLFAAFLDRGMSYSSAMFESAEESLEEAQTRKVEHILDLAGVRRGSRVLEIGIGWGTLAIAAARRGARVTGITLSREQLTLARERVADAGLSDRVDLRLQDYRAVTGSYDAIVSVEMIEAVGEEFWPEYFGTLDRLLAPGGSVALQAILMDHDRMLATRHSYSWIQKYIFPGGLIPSRTAIDETLARHTALAVQADLRFGPDYAETLRRWRRQFVASWPAVRAQGFDESFRRTWEFYLAYSEAGFASGYLDVGQLLLRRSGPRRESGRTPDGRSG
jgi:cyclopropane-fatty-acyl-phospholipid synthase